MLTSDSNNEMFFSKSEYQTPAWSVENEVMPRLAVRERCLIDLYSWDERGVLFTAFAPGHREIVDALRPDCLIDVRWEEGDFITVRVSSLGALFNEIVAYLQDPVGPNPCHPDMGACRRTV